MEANAGARSSVWKRIWRGLQSLDEGLHYREGDYLSERISRLEKDVEMLKAKLFQRISSDTQQKS
jgi:hypothetical protein